MALMQCDVCGKALTMDVSGEFALCEFCGVKHPRERLIEKVKEVNGEATVEEEATVSEPTVDETPVVEEPAEESVVESIEEPAEEPALAVSEPPVIEQSSIGMDDEDDFLSDFEEPIIIGNPVINSTPVEEVASSAESVEEVAETEEKVSEPEDEHETAVEEVPVEEAPVEETASEVTSETPVSSVLGDAYSTVIVSSGSDKTMVDEQLEEKKKALREELKEFEEMYENNRNSFFGEGLKRKNYANMKINEINDRLRELVK